MFVDSSPTESARLQNCPNKNGKTVPCRRNAVQENTAGVTVTIREACYLTRILDKVCDFCINKHR